MRHTVVLHHAHPACISPHARARRAIGRLMDASHGLLILRGRLSIIHHVLRLLAGWLMLLGGMLLLEVGVLRRLLVKLLLVWIMRGRQRRAAILELLLVRGRRIVR